MDATGYTTGVTIENVSYAGVWNQTLAPELKVPNPEGDSLSRPLTEPPKSSPFKLSIDEHLLAMQRSREVTRQLNEAYDEDAEREDEEFFRSTSAYYHRRRTAED